MEASRTENSIISRVSIEKNEVQTHEYPKESIIENPGHFLSLWNTYYIRW